MLCRVLPLRLTDARRPRSELQSETPMLGQLFIRDWREGNADERALRVATLHHPSNRHHPELLLPLFDPVLVRMTAAGLLLVGYENSVQENFRVVQYVQEWWVCAANETDKNAGGLGQPWWRR